MENPFVDGVEYPPRDVPPIFVPLAEQELIERPAHVQFRNHKIPHIPADPMELAEHPQPALQHVQILGQEKNVHVDLPGVAEERQNLHQILRPLIGVEPVRRLIQYRQDVLRRRTLRALPVKILDAVAVIHELNELALLIFPTVNFPQVPFEPVHPHFPLFIEPPAAREIAVRIDRTAASDVLHGPPRHEVRLPAAQRSGHGFNHGCPVVGIRTWWGRRT